MQTKTQKELVEILFKAEQVRFMDFVLSHEGDYAISDADWNYKDIPHLKYVHQLLDVDSSVIQNDYMSVILFQKVFGFKLPLVFFNYQSGKDRQTYYTSLLFFIMIVETSYESIHKNRTKVNTKYCIGAKGVAAFFLPLFFPFIKHAITKNHEHLMTEDIPMRERRGLLRAWGYRFKGDDKPYGFAETCHIYEPNIIPPEDCKKEPVEKTVFIDQELSHEGSLVLIGRSDMYGMSIQRQGQDLLFFPRLCSHEGACLDQKQTGGMMICPWHGRKFKPLATLSLNKEGFHQIGDYEIRVRQNTLHIASKA